MDFEQWTRLMHARVRRAFPAISILKRDPGWCYVLGIAAIDMIELIGNRVLFVPHKDPLRMVDGQLYSRHTGKTLNRPQFGINDHEFLDAFYCICAHLSPIANRYDSFYEEE